MPAGIPHAVGTVESGPFPRPPFKGAALRTRASYERLAPVSDSCISCLAKAAPFPRTSPEDRLAPAQREEGKAGATRGSSREKERRSRYSDYEKRRSPKRV